MSRQNLQIWLKCNTKIKFHENTCAQKVIWRRRNQREIISNFSMKFKQLPRGIFWKGILQIFTKFVWKLLRQSLFFNKVESLRLATTPAKMVSCKVYEIFKNTCFVEHLWTAEISKRFLKWSPPGCSFFQIICLKNNWTGLDDSYQWSLSIPPKNIRKQDIFWSFQGV